MKDSKYLLWATIIISVCMLISAIPITYEVPCRVKELYYVDVPYSSPVYETIYHKAPIYETVSRDEPIYDTVYRRDPIHETLQNV